MSNEVIVQQEQSLTAREIRAQVNLIQEVMKAVMKEGTHFGTIPGCPKPSLFKPGAEKIAVTFRIAVKSTVEDLSSHDEKRYRVTCTAFTKDGVELGSSVGECSSDEAKYRWRKPVCDQEFLETDVDRKREKWINTKTGAIKVKQIRTEIADLANTILQMADKRAYVAVIRKVTAASDVFTSDIEDLPPEIQADMVEQSHIAPAGKPSVTMPQEKAPDPQPAQPEAKYKAVISDAQSKRLYAIRKSVGYPDQDFKEWLLFEYGTDDRNIRPNDYNKIVEHVQGWKPNANV